MSDTDHWRLALEQRLNDLQRDVLNISMRTVRLDAQVTRMTSWGGSSGADYDDVSLACGSTEGGGGGAGGEPDGACEPAMLHVTELTPNKFELRIKFMSGRGGDFICLDRRQLEALSHDLIHRLMFTRSQP